MTFYGKATAKTREININSAQFDNFFDPPCTRAQYTDDSFC